MHITIKDSMNKILLNWSRTLIHESFTMIKIYQKEMTILTPGIQKIRKK